MNFDQLVDKAESECSFLGDKRCTRIYISASGDIPTLPDISNAFVVQTGKNNVNAEIITTGSYGYYDLEPIIRIDKPDQPSVLFRNATPDIVEIIVNEYLLNNRPVRDVTLGSIGEERINGIPDINDLALFSLQNRMVLRNCGKIDPCTINHYILESRGFSGLVKVLGMPATDIISELRKSGLRGKGGSGYCTADKWQICIDAQSDEKVVVCNAVDSDPDSQTARLLLQSDPYSVLEGMLIAAYAVGASRCYICVNSRNPGTVQQVKKSLDQMAEYRLIGENILDSGFRCEIGTHEELDSLISGEETALIRSLEGKQLDFEHIRLLTSGSAPLLVNDFQRIAQIFGKQPVEREGMSETGMNFSNPLRGERKPGSIGLPLPGLQVRIVDPDTFADAPRGGTGEIWLKSESITPGYWRKPQETSETFRQGWFRTGDLGKVDADGYFYLTDRIKHIIITGGENVSAKEVENVINGVDGVAESAVVGIADETWGEKVVAAVAAKPEHVLNPEEIQKVCKQQLHNWKCPKQIVFVEELPRNTMGKVLKDAVKALFEK